MTRNQIEELLREYETDSANNFGYVITVEDAMEVVDLILQNKNCEGCKYDLSFAKPCHLCNRQTHLKDLFEPKDKE